MHVLLHVEVASDIDFDFMKYKGSLIFGSAFNFSYPPLFRGSYTSAHVGVQQYAKKTFCDILRYRKPILRYILRFISDL